MSEPHLSFRHAALKIKWADKLFDALNREVESFVERKPYCISLEPDPDRGGYLFQVDLTEPMPFAIPCLIGDICHNLRASGDFCWMGLLRAENPEAEKRTLPITSNARGIETTVAQIFKGEAPVKIVELLVDGVKSHQDFNAGGNMCLSDLNYLSNWQKHNLLVPAIAITELGDNTVIKSNDGSSINLSRASVSGRVAGLGGTHAEMTYDSEPTVKVFIDLKYLGKRQPLAATLFDFRQTMGETLKAFCEAFPSPDNPAPL